MSKPTLQVRAQRAANRIAVPSSPYAIAYEDGWLNGYRRATRETHQLVRFAKLVLEAMEGVEKTGQFDIGPVLDYLEKIK